MAREFGDWVNSMANSIEDKSTFTKAISKAKGEINYTNARVSALEFLIPQCTAMVDVRDRLIKVFQVPTFYELSLQYGTDLSFDGVEEFREKLLRIWANEKIVL